MSKGAKKCWKKPQLGLMPGFSKKFLPWLIWYISIAIIWGKKGVMPLYDFRTYFFPLGEVAASFLNLLSTAINNFIKWNSKYRVSLHFVISQFVIPSISWLFSSTNFVNFEGKKIMKIFFCIFFSNFLDNNFWLSILFTELQSNF